MHGRQVVEEPCRKASCMTVLNCCCAGSVSQDVLRKERYTLRSGDGDTASFPKHIRPLYCTPSNCSIVAANATVGPRIVSQRRSFASVSALRDHRQGLVTHNSKAILSYVAVCTAHAVKDTYLVFITSIRPTGSYLSACSCVRAMLSLPSLQGVKLIIVACLLPGLSGKDPFTCTELCGNA